MVELFLHDLKPKHRNCPPAQLTFEKFDADAQKAIQAAGTGLFYPDAEDSKPVRINAPPESNLLTFGELTGGAKFLLLPINAHKKSPFGPCDWLLTKRFAIEKDGNALWGFGGKLCCVPDDAPVLRIV